MKKIFYTVSLFLLFLIPAAQAVELPEFPFIFAQGEATVDVPPDIATVSFRIEKFDENELIALQEVQKRSAELIEFFLSLKIQKEDIIGYEINKNAVRERKDYTELKILGYELNRKFSVKLKDLKQYGTFVKKLLSLKNVVDIDSKFDRSDREKIETELVSKSCLDARANAEFMAHGFNVKLGDVYAISKSGFENIGINFRLDGARISDSLFMSAYASGKGDLLFIPSTIKLGNTVTAIFRLKNE